MPMYSLRSHGDGGFGSISDIGFYHDAGAIAYARRTAGSAAVEVWRDDELIAVVNRSSFLARSFDQLAVPMQAARLS